MSNFNYKITYSYLQSFPKIKGSKTKLIKQTVNLGFDFEPTDDDIERKVKEWVDVVQRKVMNDLEAKIEFHEILNSKKLKVVKGIVHINLD
ncbi:hypothetical protein [Peijinzhouia sedimentorum]